MLEESATQAQQMGRASLIAHETAHMWFGDLVTMNWFDDVWTKEVFANFMASKIVQPSFPEVNHQLRFLLAHHDSAYRVDRSAGANPIRQPLENLNEAGTLYGPIIYQKAVSRWIAGVSTCFPLRKCDLARTHWDSRSSIEYGPGCVECCLGRRTRAASGYHPHDNRRVRTS